MNEHGYGIILALWKTGDELENHLSFGNRVANVGKLIREILETGAIIRNIGEGVKVGRFELFFKVDDPSSFVILKEFL